MPTGFPSQVAASKCSSQQVAAWGGQQALLPLLLTAWGEQQSPARAGKAVSSQQFHNLLLGKTFQQRDPTWAACMALQLPSFLCHCSCKMGAKSHMPVPVPLWGQCICPQGEV